MFCLQENYLKMTLIRINLNIFLLFTITSLTQSLNCANSKTHCGEDQTCCKLSSGKNGCCPLLSAQCCADGLHCCPNGTDCNNKEGSCHQIRHQKKPTQLKLWSTELCPDKNHTCPHSKTCCKEKSGDYGCCPYHLDLLHCCPHGTTCDIIHRQCVHPSNQINNENGFSFDKSMRLIGFKAHNISDVVCPGGRYDCPDGNTCCQISATDWGCCPLKDAVCCDDRLHCCPNGYKCYESGCQSL